MILGIIATMIVLMIMPTTAWAASSGSIAVFDSSDGSLRFYNSTTAASYVVTSTQTKYTNIESRYWGLTTEGGVWWRDIKSSIRSVDVVDDGIQPSDMNYWFSGCQNLQAVNLSKLDTSDCLKFRNLFADCSSLTDISSLAGWTIPSGALSTKPDFEYMFAGCSGLVDISAISGWNTSKVEDFEGIFQGCTSIEVADLSGWSTDGISLGVNHNRYPSFSDSYKLRRLTINNNVRLTDSPLAEHPIRGTTDQNWELEGGDGTPLTTTALATRINNKQGAGTWVWHTMTATEFDNSARIEERENDPIDNQWRTATDGHAGQNIPHRIAITFPSVISSYSSFPITIEENLGGLELSSTNDVTIDIDGTDITNDVKSGGYGSIVNSGGTLTVTIGDALSGFGKGLSVNSQSILNVNYQAHTTATSPIASTTSAKMSYPSPPSRPTIEPSETTVANTLTGSYSLTIAKVDRTERTALQGVGLTVSSQAYSKYVQADGSLGDTPYEFTTGTDGTVGIPHIGRGTFLVHETQPAAEHEAGGDAIMSVSPTYSYDPAGISALAVGADGDNVSQPEAGQTIVGETQDGIAGVDATTGSVLLRLSSPATQQGPDPSDPSPTTSPDTYTIEVLKVDMATRQPVAHVGYRVSTEVNGNTYYVEEDGTLSASQSDVFFFETDNEGIFSVSGLDEGSYVFHEVSRPQDYATDTTDFTVAITATRNPQTNELTALNATYTGGIEEMRHKGTGYAAGREDGVLSASVSTGKVSVRSSMEYVIPMPKAGLEGKMRWILPVAIALSYATTIALYLARKDILEKQERMAEDAKKARRRRNACRKRTR